MINAKVSELQLEAFAPRILVGFVVVVVFIAQNKMTFPAGGGVCVPLSRSGSEAEGHGKAPVLHWALQDSDGSTSTRTLQMAKVL